MKYFIEADQKEFMSKKEEQLKRQLIALLKDDGLGHHHALFADRLKDFTVKIIDDDRICPTASMDFDNGIIRINAGFLRCPPPKPGEKFPALFRQLSVLMRHELAHALMMHQVRMKKVYEKKYGKEAVNRLMKSKSMHELENIIADFEISNTRYTDEDKEAVRHLWLNGELIGGLVTEEHRPAWYTDARHKYSLEQMYEAINTEIDTINEQIVQALAAQNTNNLNFGRDMIKHVIANTHYYLDITGDSNFISKGFTLDVIEDFINNKALYHFFPLDAHNKNGQIILCVLKASSMFEEWVNVIKNIHDELLNTENSKDLILEADINKILTEIAHTGPATVYKIIHPYTNKVIETLYTPEEKLLAVDTLKELININKSYEIWFNKVKNVLANPKYTEADLKELEDALK